MKELTRIEPESEVNEEIAIESLKWLSEGATHGLYEGQVDSILRLLVHKVNELTDEVNRIKKTIENEKYYDRNSRHDTSK